MTPHGAHRAASSSTSRRRWLVGAASVGLLALGACGGGNHLAGQQQPVAGPKATQPAVTPAPTTAGTAPAPGAPIADPGLARAQADLTQLNTTMTSLDGELSSADQAVANGG